MDAWMKKYLCPIVGILGLLLISCSTPSVPPNKLVDGYCDIAQPILLLKAEIPLLSRGTKSQILIHNKTWEQHCGNAEAVSGSKG